MRNCFALLTVVLALAGCVPAARLHEDAMDGSPRRDGGPSDGGGRDARPPPVEPYAGLWAGVTDQGRLISFRVFADAVTTFSAGYDVEADAVVAGQPAICHATGGITSSFGMPQELGSTGRLEIGPISTKSDDGSAAIAYTLRGTLDGDSTSDGTFELTYKGPNCDAGTVTLRWSAEHVVCGDGVLEWPETCDEGEAERVDDCSELCQLDVVQEREPNNRPVDVSQVLNADTVVTGSLSGELDVDVFGIHNTRPGTVGVRLETHGETIGTCQSGTNTAETQLDLIDSDGNVVDTDKGSSRMPFCALLSRPLDAGETLYVRVSSPKRETIGRYHLSVAFQQR